MGSQSLNITALLSYSTNGSQNLIVVTIILLDYMKE